MFISRKRALTYIRVPKTGSSVVYMAGAADHRCEWNIKHNDIGLWTHTNVADIPACVKNCYKTHKWVFAIRHPLTWIPSLWSWLGKNSERARMDYAGTLDIPYDWYEFVSRLKVTPYDWIYDPDHIIDDSVHVYKQEDPRPMSEWMGGVPLTELKNVTRKRREFTPNDQILAIIEQKFHRELAHYLPGTLDRPDAV